jgi:hypothetical protein
MRPPSTPPYSCSADLLGGDARASAGPDRLTVTDGRTLRDFGRAERGLVVALFGLVVVLFGLAAVLALTVLVLALTVLLFALAAVFGRGLATVLMLAAAVFGLLAVFGLPTVLALALLMVLALAAFFGLALTAVFGLAALFDFAALAREAVAVGLADDMVLAAVVSALAAVDMALVAVFIDCMAVDIVLADDVALVAAAVILVAAEVTLVAAEDTVRAAVAVVGAVLADARRVVLAVVALAFSLAPGREAATLAARALVDLPRVVLAGLRRVAVRVVVCTGTDLPPVLINTGDLFHQGQRSTHALIGYSQNNGTQAGLNEQLTTSDKGQPAAAAGQRQRLPRRRWAVSFSDRTSAGPSLNQSISHSEATSRWMRNSAAGGASIARHARVLIGVTWLTSSSVRRGWSVSSWSSAPTTRRAAVAKLSPPGGATSALPSHAVISSGHRAAASANVIPSHLPKSASTRSSCTCSGAPVASATVSAVRLARCSGEVTITSMPPRAASRVAAAAAWRRPSRDSGMSPRPANLRSTDSAVWPCLSSSVVVGCPCGGPHPRSATVG